MPFSNGLGELGRHPFT